MKLGEILIEKGMITREQLKETLRAQLIFGGQLGTCLIEKGYLGEDVLGKVLGEVTGMEYAPPQLFLEIPRYVTQCVPSALAAKHSVVPFRLKDRTLHVAMIDPKNLTAVDELSFATGYKITPWVAPEARVFQALERYFAVPRRQRYVALCRQLDGDEADTEILHRIVRIEREHEYDSEARTEFEEHAEIARAADADADRLVVRRATENTALDAVSEMLCKEENPRRLAEAVMSYTALGMERSILFKMESGAARIWRASGLQIHADKMASLSFPVISEPMFALLRGEPCFRGPVPDEAAYQRFFERLQMATPAEVLVLPLYIDDRLIGFFYGDGGPGGMIRGDTHEYRRLFKKLCLALHVILLKRQIHVA